MYNRTCVGALRHQFNKLIKTTKQDLPTKFVRSLLQVKLVKLFWYLLTMI